MNENATVFLKDEVHKVHYLKAEFAFKLLQSILQQHYKISFT